MTDIESTRSAILEYLTGYTLSSNSVVARLRNAIVKSDEDSALSNASLNISNKKNTQDDDFGISLRDFTNLNSYITMMNSIYGNSSKTKFQNALANVLSAGQNTQIANAKTFIQKMKENGLSNSSALTMFKAVNSYSLVSAMSTNTTNSFVSAKI